MKLNFRKKDLFTIPNILTYIRLALIPVIVIVYLNAKNEKDFYIATFILAICAFTDSLDGYIARHYNQVTDIGKIIDPVADKAMQAAILLCLLSRIQGILPIFILFAIKEITMGIACLYLLKTGRKISGAKWFGKVCTASLFIVLMTLVFLPDLSVSKVNFLILIEMIIMFITLIFYIPEFYKLKQTWKD